MAEACPSTGGPCAGPGIHTHQLFVFDRPHANRNGGRTAAHIGGQRKGARLIEVYGDAMRREFAELPNERAVHVHLIGIAEAAWHLQRQRCSVVLDIHSQPVPGVTGVALVALPRPAGNKAAGSEIRIARAGFLGQVYRAPCRVVEVRLRPGHVVAGVEFP